LAVGGGIARRTALPPEKELRGGERRPKGRLSPFHSHLGREGDDRVEKVGLYLKTSKKKHTVTTEVKEKKLRRKDFRPTDPPKKTPPKGKGSPGGVRPSEICSERASPRKETHPPRR